MRHARPFARLVLVVGTCACAVAPSRDVGAQDAPAASNADVRLRRLYTEEWNWRQQELARQPADGVRGASDRFPKVDAASQEARLIYWTRALAALDSIPYAELSPEEKVNARVFRTSVHALATDARYKTYEAPFNADTFFWTDFTPRQGFETANEYRRYLSRLRDVPRYFGEQIVNMRAGLARGYTVPRVAVIGRDKTIEPYVKADTTNPLFAPFTMMPSSIPAAERAALRADAEAVIRERVAPAYVGLLAMIRNEYLTKARTSLDLTAQQIHDLGLSEVARITAQMEAIRTQVGFKGTRPEFFQHLRSDPKFYCRTPAELLTEYRATAKRVDPQLVRFFKTLPRVPYGVEPIPDKIAPDTTAAYYRVLAADGSRAGTYFVNLYKPEMRPRYEMMALTLHEAVPGHHLQFALAFEQGELPKFRRYGGEGVYTAYIEGWALYAESLGDEMGLYDDPYSKFGQLTYEMWRAVRLVVDTGMHAFKWERQRAIDYFLANAAKSELDVTNEVDRYISWPGQALAYKIGELKIKALRAAAAKELGAKFELREFHDLILKSGAVPLEVLEQNVREWMGRMKP